MAKFEVSGLGELIIDMEEFARLPGAVVDEMLYAGAEPVAKAQAAQYRADGLIDKGTLADSPAPALHSGITSDGRTLDVYPQGLNHAYKARSKSKKSTKQRYKQGEGQQVNTSNAEVGFIHEFGAPKRGIKATQSIRVATEKSANEAVAKEEEVYDKWLKSLGL